MSNLRQAAQRALEAMEDGEERADMIEFSDALIALRAALAEPPCKTGASCTNKCQRCAEPEHRPDCALLKIPSRDCDCAKPDQDKFCDTHCTWRDHHPDCVRAEPEQEPVCAHGVKKIKCGFCQQIGKGFAPTPQPEPIGTVKELFTQSAWERLDLQGSTKVYTAPTPRKPLTRKELWAILASEQAYDKSGLDVFYRDQVIHLIRKAEAAHGIKEQEHE